MVRTTILTAWKMNKAVTVQNVSGLLVGLLMQPQQGLVRRDDVAELHLWSSCRLLANASLQSDKQPRKLQVILLAVIIIHHTSWHPAPPTPPPEPLEEVTCPLLTPPPSPRHKLLRGSAPFGSLSHAPSMTPRR